MPTRFRFDGQSFLAGETVYHTQLREFCTVAGVSSEYLLLTRPSGAEYGASVDLLVRDVGDEAAFAARLREIDTFGNLERWFVAQWRGSGASVHACREALKRAAGDD